MSSAASAAARADRVVNAVDQALRPLHSRVQRVEAEQQAHEDRTQRQIDRMEALNNEAVGTVVKHVVQLAKLEAIPDQIKALDVKVDVLGHRVGTLETRATEQDARLAGRREVTSGMKWFAEHWASLATAIGVIVIVALTITGVIRVGGQPTPIGQPYIQYLPSDPRAYGSNPWTTPPPQYPVDPLHGTNFEVIVPMHVVPEPVAKPLLRGKTDADLLGPGASP